MRVLIVDDHAGFRRFARAFLLSACFDVVGESDTGAAALASCAEIRPDVVLLDIGLPDVDGFEVARRLAGGEHRPQVVLTSSRAASEYGERLRTSPAAGFVAKNDLTRASMRAVLEGAA
jgi:two-component system nitrate/nitrite response regulator NarL